MIVLAPIVEGHGEVSAVPALLSRLSHRIRVAPPVRMNRNEMDNADKLSRYTRVAASNIQANEAGLVILFLDADSDCPSEIGPQLLRTLRDATTRACAVVVIVHEFESWIVGGHPAIDEARPDTAGAPKERLRSSFGRYKPSLEQKRLITEIDMDRLAERSASFSRLQRIVRETLARNAPRADEKP